MSAEIIKFPVATIPGSGAARRGDDGPRSCDRCNHVLSGVSGTYCRALNVDVLSVHEAIDCDLYED